jgi:hypothetical protein
MQVGGWAPKSRQINNGSAALLRMGRHRVGRSIIDSHLGRLWITSFIGEGLSSAFHFNVPRYGPDDALGISHE